jgi:hypothetical protein
VQRSRYVTYLDSDIWAGIDNNTVILYSGASGSNLLAPAKKTSANLTGSFYRQTKKLQELPLYIDILTI